MKSYLPFLLLTLTLITGNSLSSQNTLQLRDIELLNLGDGQLSGHKRDGDQTPINGKVRIITGYTSEYIDAEFSEGKAIGKWEYYKDSNLSETTNYEDGYESGEKIRYYNDGKTIHSRTPLLKGKVEGTAIRYDSEGKKEYEKSMRNGIDDGPERTYDKEGEITSEIIFKNGKAEGKSFATYNKNNSDCYTKTEYYKEGKLEGEYKEEYCDGSPKVTGKYITGKKDGLWEYYKKDGSRRKPTEGYKNGELVKKISYFSNGNIDIERNYKNGKEDGVVRQYTLDGKLKSERNYVNGKQVGKQIQYYSSNHFDYIENSNYSTDGKRDGEYTEIYAESKKTKVKGQYANGQKHGKWLYYDSSGKLTREEVFENGTQKSSQRF